MQPRTEFGIADLLLLNAHGAVNEWLATNDHGYEDGDEFVLIGRAVVEEGGIGRVISVTPDPFPIEVHHAD